jgi:hypothetical protein
VDNFINQREMIKSRIMSHPQVFNSKAWQRSLKKGNARRRGEEGGEGEWGGGLKGGEGKVKGRRRESGGKAKER